jgi:excisionase family DNA binding protein
VNEITVTLPDDLVERIAARAAAIVIEHQARDRDGWLNVEEAARHLACPTSRIYALVSKRAIPFEKDGSRLLFRRTDLDTFVCRGGAIR